MIADFLIIFTSTEPEDSLFRLILILSDNASNGRMNFNNEVKSLT